MAVSRLTFRKTLAGTGLAVSLLLYTNRQRKQHASVRAHLEKGLGWQWVDPFLSSCAQKAA